MLQPGVRLGGRYRLESRIGAGGMGEVWRAVDEALRRTVAVKAMLPSVAGQADFARRFLAEATAMARVNHPGVVSIHDYGRSDDVTFLVMEFVDGESLANLLARAGRLSPADTMRVIAQAADGLQAVHDRGVVHRDIKPANLLIRRDGAVLITDFGISRADDAGRLTASGAVLGTPSYLSPEQVLGHPVTARSDIYSLGLTAYECLAGQRPFEGDNPYAVALQRLRAAPRTIGVTLPIPVLAVVERALATNPADRWPSARDLAAAARAATDPGPHVPPLPPSPLAASGPPAARAWPAGSGPPAAPGWQAGSHQPAAPGRAAGSGPPAAPGWVGGPGSVASSGQPAAPGWAAGSGPPAGPGSVASSGQPAAPGWAAGFGQPAAPGSATGPGPASSAPPKSRWWMFAALLAVLVAGSVAAWSLTRGGGEAADAGGATPQVSATPSAALAEAADMIACGTVLCPKRPTCWGGLTSISGKALQPEQVDCAEPHFWQTFAAVPMPAGAAGVRPDELMGRGDVAATCSAALLASHSRDPATTRSWKRDAWPIQPAAGGAALLHCLVGSPDGETTGSVL